MSPSPDDPYQEHWYQVVEDDSLRQGDIFRDLLVFWLPDDLPIIEGEPDEEQAEVVAEWSRGHWIVMTASCDLHQGRCRGALLANVRPATPAGLNAQPGKDFEKKFEVVRKGLDPAKFMLADCDRVEPDFPISVAFFRTHVFLPLAYLRANCTGKRLRLRSPLREKFGNWVGRRLSTVGPEDHAQIPSNGRSIYPPHVLDAIDD